MIIRCEDGTPIENLKPNSRKKIIFTCDNCGKETERIYKNYISKKENYCRSCIAKKINKNPNTLEKNREKQKKRWKNINKEEIGNKISESQKKTWKDGRKGKNKKYGYNEIKKYFETEGYTLLTTKDEYKKFNVKLKYKCPEGHIGYTDYIHWFNRGQRCGKCSKNAKLSYYYVKSEFEKHGYEFISTKEEFEDSKEHLKYKCPEGHEGTISWTHWKRGHRCSKCAGNQKIKTEDIKKSIESEGYKLFIDNVKNSKEFFDVSCPMGHIFNTCWNYWNAGYRCPLCSYEKTSSKAEIEIGDFIEELGFVIKRNNRSILKDLEVDILIESKNIAIEYCGVYWHSEIFKDKKYHINKLERCNEKGYNLITIFEDEWKYKKDIVKHRLKHILGKADKTIYARNCFVKEIDNKIAENFCLRYHIQGYQPSKIKLGLFHNKELVSVMTFGKQSLSKGNKNFDNNIWEISRFCSKYNVVGAAGKLISYFKKNYKWDKIITFADRRWSNGKLYYKLGFNFLKYTQPNYWYINMNNSDKKREHRFKYRKDKIKHLGEGTEWEIMQYLGYTRIWDCGHIKFGLLNKGE